MRLGGDVEPALLEALSREKLDTVEGAFAYTGGEDHVKPGLRHRRRTQLCVTDREGRGYELYLKRYGRENVIERLRRWWTYGTGRSPADVEFDNIQALRAAGIPTMRAVLCGEKSGPFGARRSYLIVTAVPGEKLERCIREFLDRNVDRSDVVTTFTLSLGRFVRKFHLTGCVHRDLYASHIFLDELDGRFEMRLIDLGRVFAPKWRRFRWRMKDLAQLSFSMPHRRWTEKYWDTFLKEYLGTDDESILRRWSRRIDRKARWMRRRLRRKLKNKIL